MDETDFFLLNKLSRNSRLTYRKLANITNLSVSTIHKRINKLLEDEIIEAFTARPSMIALKSLWVLIFGYSKAKSLDLLSKELGQHDNIDFVGIAGGKYIYINGILRDISELQNYSAYVSNTAQINEPTIAIINVPYMTTPESLSNIDYKILKCLNRDARKPITEIADDVGLSAKTVKKHLDRMIKNNLATFSCDWSMKAENNLITAFHIYLMEGTYLESTIQHIYKKYHQNVTYCLSYSNIPNFFTMYIWTKTAQDSHKIQEELQTEGFQDLVQHIFISSKYYDCWVDKLLRTK